MPRCRENPRRSPPCTRRRPAVRLAPGVGTPAGGKIDIGTLGGGYSEGFAINNHGQVAGSSTTASGETHAFDQQGLCRAWDLQGTADFYLGRVSAAEAAWERAADHAGRAGLEHLRAEKVASVSATMWTGARPVDEGLRRCDEILGEVHGHLASEAEVLRPLAGLHGFAGRFELARSLFAQRNETLDELGRGVSLTPSNTEAFVEMPGG